jgi:hypothetical protein
MVMSGNSSFSRSSTSPIDLGRPLFFSAVMPAPSFG